MSSGQDGASDQASELFPFAERRKRRKGGPNAMVVAVVLLGLLAAGAWGLMTFGPKTAILDTLNGAKPDVGEAKACLQNGNVDCAVGDYRAYLKQYPNDANANAVLAILLTGTGHHREALPYYRQAGKLGIGTYDFHGNYARSLDAVGDVDAAIRENQAALKIVPTLVDAQEALADELVKKGRGREAVEMLEAFDRKQEAEGQSAYFAYKIDQMRDFLRLGGSARPAEAAAAASEVPLRASQGGLVATGTVDGSLKLDFMVDSGASFVCIPASVAETLKRQGQLGPYDHRGYGMAILADGSRVPAELVVLHSLEVGGHKATNVLACVTKGPGALLLGQSFLKRFKSWSVDNDRRVLVLKQ